MYQENQWETVRKWESMRENVKARERERDWKEIFVNEIPELIA